MTTTKLTNDSITLSRRLLNDGYGSGVEVTVTAFAVEITDANAADYGFDGDVPLDRSTPWAIMLTGTRTVYGPGSAVLSVNSIEPDPNGEWRRDMQSERPTRDQLQALGGRIIDLWYPALWYNWEQAEVENAEKAAWGTY